MTTRYEHHPLASALPAISGAEFKALVADIKAHGQRDPITLFKGMILDGRHRDAACVELGLEVVTRTFKGTEAEAEAFVYSKNIVRRHMTLEQRIAFARKVVETNPDLSNSEIAKKANVSDKTVAKQRKDANAPTTKQAKAAKVKKAAAENPDASAREIARKTGTDHKTVAKLRKGGENSEFPSFPQPTPPVEQKIFISPEVHEVFYKQVEAQAKKSAPPVEVHLTDSNLEAIGLIPKQTEDFLRDVRRKNDRDLLDDAEQLIASLELVATRARLCPGKKIATTPLARLLYSYFQSLTITL
jgi:hypothetical protein